MAEKKRIKKFHVVSLQDGCWQYLRSADNYSDALGIVYSFVQTVLLDDYDEVFTVKLENDTSNFLWEQVNVTIHKNNNHAELEYPIIIFYELYEGGNV